MLLDKPFTVYGQNFATLKEATDYANEFLSNPTNVNHTGVKELKVYVAVRVVKSPPTPPTPPPVYEDVDLKPEQLGFKVPVVRMDK